jgi:hypothetical protein
MRINTLKQFAVVLLVFFLPRFASGQGDSTARIVQNVADSVEANRVQDSTDAADVFLLPFRQEIFICAQVDSLPPALLAAFIQEESNFNQWATRTEPHYKKKKIVITAARKWSKRHGGIPTYYTELDDRSRSYGLMQVMGQLAREQGFDAKYLPELFVPLNSISQGAIKLRQLLNKYKGDTLSAISAYNQGNNRRKNGRLVNYRYVYRVGVAWEMYEKIFKKQGLINERQNFYHETDGHNDTVSIRLGLSSRFFTWVQPPMPKDGTGFSQSYKRNNPDGTASGRFNSDNDPDPDSLFVSPGGSYPIKYVDQPIKGFTEYQFFITTGFLSSLLGFCWLFFTRYVPDSAGYDFRLRRSVDKRTRTSLKAKFKTARDRRALYRPRFAGLPKGFYNHNSN